jgi:DNA polymerase III sliding clamp (beta) subunit (PCNA family)
MLIKVNIKDLREGIQQASYTLDPRAGGPGSNLYMVAKQAKPSGQVVGQEDKSCLYLYSTNLGLARTLLKIPAEVTKPGATLIPPKLLQSILQSLPGEESIKLGLSPSGSRLSVEYGTIQSQIAVHADGSKAAEVLQAFPFNAKPLTTVSAASLVDIVTRVLFCTAGGTTSISEGPWLASILLETGDGSIMGTGTNRIIAGQAEVHDQLVKGGFSGAIHRDALTALKAILAKKKEEEVTITNVTADNTANEILFRFSDVILGIRQLAKGYPKAVAKVFSVPNIFHKATVNRKALLGIFGRLSAFAEKNAFSISFAKDTALVVTKGFNSTFEERVAITGKDLKEATIGLGIADTINVLSVMASEDVVIHYGTDTDHVHFQEGDANFHYVLSPAQVSWLEKKKGK